MAISSARRGTESESGGWGGQLISISDLMAGLLFIFILIVLYFALELNRMTQTQKQVVDEMTNTLDIRQQLLKTVDEELRRLGVTIEVDYENGILSFREGILFPSGSATLRPEGSIALDKLGQILDDVLPCYTGAPTDPLPAGCASAKTRGRLEAIFIEGHTDTVRTGASSAFRDNWDLSAARSISVFKEMSGRYPSLDHLQNSDRQPLFSVSGYADRRPVGGDISSNRTEQGRSRNRRIDLRFIMKYPEKPQVVRDVQRRLVETGIK
jgi:chemotaxis protein MotB